ncbi:MAG: 1-acyl-sn-glycerol-3-phosphate acyltransferase [Bacteroidales bacterium]|nr:1-acyl-sn-glycerol-3-phosphate acyltransferase [Bacteroidales bacterium]
MKNIFLNIYRYLSRHRAILWGGLGVLTLLCVLSALRINFVEDISSFLPRNKDNKRINYAYEHIGTANKIMVNICQISKAKDDETATENIDYELLCDAANRFAELFQETAVETCHDESQNTDLDKSAETCHGASLLYKVDQDKINDITAFVIENMPYFLTEDDYARMDTLLSYEHISEQLANDKQLLASPMAALRTIIQKDPLFFSANILQSLNNFRPDNGYHIEDSYIFNKEGNEALIVITSPYPVSETQNNAKLIQEIHKTAHEVEEEFKHQVHVSSFGAAEVSLTNAQQIKKDSFLAISLSLIFILALLIYYYRNARSILLIFLSTLAGGLFALGVIAWVKNPVSLIAIGVASIIIGIAINYPIHFLSHFKRTDDKEQIIKDIVTPLLTGNITTVGAFVSLMFISSDAMKDLGLFAALLLVGTILFVLIFLPHLLGKHYPGKDRQLAFRSVAEFRPEKHGLIMVAVVVLTIVFYHFSSRTSFDTDMHHINYMTEEQRQAFEKLLASSTSSDTEIDSDGKLKVEPIETTTLYCIAEGNTLDEALEYNEKIVVETNGRASLQQINGIGNFMPSKAMQGKRLALWNQFWKGKKDTFLQNLDKAAAENGFSPLAFQPCKNIIDQEYEIQDNQYFNLIKGELAANYISEEEGHCLVYNLLKVNKNDADKVETLFNGIDKHIFAFTDSSIAARLVDALSKDFDYVLFICGLIVFAFLLLSFGRIEICLMAFTPLIIAWIWILGIMGMTDIRFNIVNIILATFIFGMGDDYSIFVTEGLSYEYRFGRSMLSQFKNSIILSSSIMFIGIGMLIFAKHPAMKSLAEVTIIGMLSVVLMAYIIPPFIFKWLTQKKGKLRKQPVTIVNFSRTVFAFSFFICGTIFLSLVSFFLLTIGGKSERHKQQYHKLLQKTMKFIAWGMPQVNYRVDNPQGEDFSKPAVIICNHQSHFDLVYTLMLSPKIIALTNKWVWNFPLYRGIVRGADFLPVTDGIEENIPKLKELTDKGYSILVFPEGTRSTDCSILRFHQGAFHLAKELSIDILPLVLHGVGHCLPKDETLLRRGKVSISIEQRISPDNSEFLKGKESRETARLVRHFYQQRYAEICQREEDLDYYLDNVSHNYLYKGREVAQECRYRLKNCQKIRDLMPKLADTGKMLIRNCGQGEYALLLALVKKNWQIYACDTDSDNIDTARNCVAVPANLHYTTEEIEETGYDCVMDIKDIGSKIYYPGLRPPLLKEGEFEI